MCVKGDFSASSNFKFGHNRGSKFRIREPTDKGISCLARSVNLDLIFHGVFDNVVFGVRTAIQYILDFINNRSPFCVKSDIFCRLSCEGISIFQCCIAVPACKGVVFLRGGNGCRDSRSFYIADRINRAAAVAFKGYGRDIIPVSVEDDVSCGSGSNSGYLATTFSCSIPSLEYISRKSCVIESDVVGYNICCRVSCSRSTIGYILNGVGYRSPFSVKCNISIASLGDDKVCRSRAFFVGKPTVEGVTLFGKRIDCEVIASCVVVSGVIVSCTVHIIVGDVVFFKPKLCVYRDIIGRTFNNTDHLCACTNVLLGIPAVKGVSYGLADKSYKLELILYGVCCFYNSSFCIVPNRIVVKESNGILNSFPLRVKLNRSGRFYGNFSNLVSKAYVTVPTKETVTNLTCIRKREGLIFYIVGCWIGMSCI